VTADAARGPVEGPAVVLIGPMMSGKTRIGKRVARRLGLPFVDTDARVVAEHGAVEAIFAAHGEPRFRELERSAVARALTEHAVVSLGGGAVLDPSTQELLAGLPVVLLMVDAEAVGGRLASSRRARAKRPLLAAEGIAAWTRIVDERRPVYERLARATWDTSTRPADTVADEIAGWVRTGATERAGVPS